MIWRRMRVFISYAREDQKRADALYDSLQEAGFRPWMDRRDIPAASDWKVEIDRAVRRSHAFIACISTASVKKTADLGGVLTSEIDGALQRWKRRWWWWQNLFLLPVRFEKCDPPQKLARLQWVDAFEDRDWVNVARGLRKAQNKLIFGSVSAVSAVVIAAIIIGSIAEPTVIAAFRKPGGVPRAGITVWKLEQAAPNPGAKTLLHEVNCKSEKDWKPLRADPGQPFHDGDHVRVSIESGIEGFVYVVDREIRNNKPGQPKLMFPTTRVRGGDNHVSPGMLIELPDQQDCPPYWTLSGGGDRSYSGELITVLIVDHKLKEIMAGSEPQYLPNAVWDSWLKKWTVPLITEVNHSLSQRPSTELELAAGQGAKTLTHGDPGPQMVFQRKDSGTDGILVEFTISVQRDAP